MESANNSDAIKINSISKAHLLIIVKWTRFLSILGYITTSLSFVLWIAMIRGKFELEMEPGVGEVLGWPMAIICGFALSSNLSKFTRAIKSSLKMTHSDGLADALGFLKAYFRLVGVLSVLIAIPILLFWLGVINLIYDGLVH
jgi:hypothetical protein